MKIRPLIGVAIAASLALAACGGSDSASDTTMPAAAAEGIDLKAAGCPETVVIQTDWFPQAEHGNLYNLVGPGYKIDAKNLTVTGDLISSGKTTGVKVQVRAGGPAIGFGRPIASMYENPEILLGFVGTDEAISQSTAKPSIAVVAPFNVNPQIIMWDPVTYPNVKKISDLKDLDVKVRYRQDADYMKFLIQSGQLDEKQTDDTYDGTAAAFVASGGKDAQQGFGTNEPYAYKNIYKEWMKDVSYQYVHDAGWTAYQQSLAAIPANIEKYDSCLKVLVPVIQQSTVDYMASPETSNEIILDAVTTYNQDWTYSIGQADAAVDQMLADKMIANSPDGTLGSFEIDRVTQFIKAATPIYKATGDVVKEALVAEDIVTNKYIDPSIKLG